MTEQPGATPEQQPPATGGTTTPNDQTTTTQTAVTADADKVAKSMADGAEAGKPEDQLGDAGKKLLADQRTEIKELKAKLGKLDGLDIDALTNLANALGGKPSGDTKTDLERLTERLAEVEESAATERLARLRLEVATDKGLTPRQAARLQGNTRDELAADADDLLATFPQQASNGQPAGGGSPRPDPTQGSRGSGDNVDARIAEAEEKGDYRTAIALKAQRLAQQQTSS